MTVDLMGVGLTVEFGFGHGPAEADGAITWTDCSDWVRTSPGVGITRGRSAESLSIPVGTMSLTLDNIDGRFDVENDAGPYAGMLIDGTPVRVRTTVNGSTETIFSGWVETWPLVDQGIDSVVDISCSDIFGLLARSRGPATAFDATVRSLAVPPDHWWRPGPTGWEDQITGITMRHSGALDEMDPLVNGDDGSWGQAEPDGRGSTTNPNAGIDSGDPYDWSIISAWVQLAPAAERPLVPVLGIPSPVTVIAIQGDYSGHITGPGWRALLNITHVGVTFRYTTGHGRAEWSTESPANTDTLLMDGRLHHVVAVGRPEFSVNGAPPPNLGGQAALWIDGRRIDLYGPGGDSSPFLPNVTYYDPLDVTIGDGYAPYQGAIDHIQTWGIWPGTADTDADMVDIEALAQGLFTAGRFGWANQRIDERASNIVTAMGAADRLGAFDTSGVTTLQSYRQGEPLQLLQTVEDTEQGRIWVDRDGDINYSNRQWAWNSPTSTTVQASFSDTDDGNSPILADGFAAGRDARKVTNVAQVTSAFGRMQTVRDEASIAVRGERSVHLSGLLHRSDAESRAIAEWIVASRSTPSSKVERFSFNATESPDAAQIAQQVDETWLVEVIRRGRTFLGHVTQILHSITEAGWVVTLSLDSTRTDSTWFRWGTSEWDNTDSEGWSF